MIDLRNNPLGIYEKALPNAFSWEDKIITAQRAGFDFIEMSIDESDLRLARLKWSKKERKALKNILEKYDFKIRSMCLSGHRRFPFGSAKEQTRKRAFEIMDDAIALSVDLGIRNIQLAGYDVYYEESDEASISRFVEGLNYAARKAERENIMLSIEIMDTYLCGTLSRAQAFVDQVKSPYLKLYPDLGNLSRWTEDPVKEIEMHFSNIVAIHLKDTKPNIFKCVPFGEGTVDFSSLFNTLRQSAYAGPFLIEMWADNDNVLSIDAYISQLEHAKQWLYDKMR